MKSPDDVADQAQVSTSAVTKAEAPPKAERSLEVEIKLGGEAEVLDRAWRTVIAGRGSFSTKNLESTYFDTSDLRLRRRGFTLRVRHDGQRYVQTMKAEGDGDAGMMRRSEWTTPVRSRRPDLSKMADSGLMEQIGLILPEELQPLFTTKVTRRLKKRTVSRRRQPKTVIEIALDQGEIIVNGKSEAISEIEFELLEGQPKVLYEQAAKLHGKIPLRIETLSKAKRGFALASGEHFAGQKASKIELDPDISLGDALGHIFQACGRHWLANHAAVLDGNDPEGVHQMRVALRRMRSALSVFKSVLPPDDLAWLAPEAKELIGSLGPARDWDVFIDELLRPVIEANPQDSNLKVLEEAVRDEQVLAYQRARGALRSPRYTAFVLRLGAWLESGGWQNEQDPERLERPLVELADELLRKRHKKSLKLGRDFEELPDEDLHRLRISLKKLRYTTEFFVSLYPRKKTTPFLIALRALQDDLGHLNDVAVAEQRLGELSGTGSGDNVGALRSASGLVLGWYGHALAQIRPRIAEDWYSFTDARPFWHHKKH